MEGGPEGEFIQWIDIDEIAQIGTFRFMEEIASHGYDFILYALFELDLMKRFECRNDT